MTVKIIRANKTLWPACEVASSRLQKMLGIMFKKQFKPLLFDFGVQATHRNAIHSLFCPSFDAVFLDSNKKVVQVLSRIKPWKPWIAPKKPAQYLIEAPAGDAERLKIMEGDEIEWVQ